MNVAAVAIKKHEEIPAERLAANKTLSEQEKIAEASRQFEAVLLRQILSDARKPVFKSSLTEKSATSAIYDDMVTSQFADSISRSGEFGLARSLASQLKPETKQPDSTSSPTTEASRS